MAHILKPSTRIIFLRSSTSQSRSIHTSQNRIYNSIRSQPDFQTLLSLSTTNNIPLITFWTTSSCPTCRISGPIIREIIKNPDGRYLSPDVKVGFAEVEMDAPDVGYALGARYLIRSIPTLLAFKRDLPQYEEALTGKENLKDRQKLVRWIEEVAKEWEAERNTKGLFGSWFS